jgi:hypothetical protein
MMCRTWQIAARTLCIPRLDRLGSYCDTNMIIVSGRLFPLFDAEVPRPEAA